MSLSSPKSCSTFVIVMFSSLSLTDFRLLTRGKEKKEQVKKSDRVHVNFCFEHCILVR